MGTPGNLVHWMQELLPQTSACAHRAAARLLRSLLVGFTTNLTQLARQDAHAATAKSGRQCFARWLDRSDWAPETLYAHLNRQTRRVLQRWRTPDVPLLVDFTDLEKQWTVLQVSLPWQRRALPLYRAVVRYTDPEVGRRELVRQAWAFLRQHLPAPASRYLLVMDRGFPGHWLVRELTAADWRFVLRVTSTWKVQHEGYTGALRDAPAALPLAGAAPQLLAGAVLGRRGKGREEWSEANVVVYHGAGRREPWFLVTSEREAARAVAIYQQRMQIECEFRDLKGPFGLDELSGWQDRDRVARFLALVAVYEWRLAQLWAWHHLQHWGPRMAVKGRLSWIRVTREWIQWRLRRKAKLLLASL